MLAGEAMALAEAGCARCGGAGRTASGRVCGCVWRRVFRACWERWQAVQQDPPRVRMKWIRTNGARYGVAMSWEWRGVEFGADFELAARKALEPAEWRLFRLHYLDGRECRACAQMMNLSVWRLRRAARRIEEKLGRYFEGLRPYPLWPLRDYFGDEDDGRASGNRHIVAGAGGAGAERVAEGADARRSSGVRGTA